MTCPTCQLHAGLLTSGEYEDQNDKCLSNDAVLKSREFMIERSRAQIKGSSDESRVPEHHDGHGVLHSVTSILLVHGQTRTVRPFIASESSARVAITLLQSRLNLLAICFDGTESMREALEESASHAGIINDHFGLPQIQWGNAMRACIRESAPAVAPVQFKQAAE